MSFRCVAEQSLRNDPSLTLTADATQTVEGCVFAVATSPSGLVLVDTENSISFLCHATVSCIDTSTLRYQWLLNGVVLSDDEEGTYVGSNSANLTIYDVNGERNSSALVCRVSVSGLAVEWTEESISVDLRAIGEPIITVHPQSTVARYSRPLKLSCKGEPGDNGLVVTYYWLRNGTVFNETLSQSLTRVDSHLEWSRVYPSDTGTYQCVVKQAPGNQIAISHEAEIVVEDEELRKYLILFGVVGGVVLVMIAVRILDQKYSISFVTSEAERQRARRFRLQQQQQLRTLVDDHNSDGSDLDSLLPPSRSSDGTRLL
eukprot:c9061_g1_i1.p1 GENE.c9061_g1_i1~~c9061_g1_i1.p1  ORF type:complete len:316 (-),score=73.71 c9061_g1_i1:98-1045(-)